MKFRIPLSLQATMTEARRVARETPLLLWSLFLVFFPVYVFRSGMPQPADCILVVLFPMLLTRWNRKLGVFAPAFKLLLGFALYSLALNMLWSVALMKFTTDAKQGFLLSPTFYLYNAVMYLTVIMLYQRYGLRFLWVTVRVTFLSVTLEVLLSFFMKSHGLRDALFFNRANQLGYYALLCACILLLGLKKLQMSTFIVTIGLLECCYLCLMSASRAGLASIAMLGAVLLLSKIRYVIAAALLLTILAVTPNPFSRAIERAEARIERTTDRPIMEERGYNRMLKHKEYWVFGAGEGAYVRFVDDGTIVGTHELHSSAATLVFCYGVIGVVLFLGFCWFALRGASFRVLLIVMPAFAYGMSHQGIRFALFWVMLGVAVTIAHYERAEKRRPAPTGALAPARA